MVAVEWRHIPRVLFILICWIGWQGCAFQKMVHTSKPDEINLSGADSRVLTSPFAVDVLDEWNDGKQLHLRVRIKTKGIWDSSAVVLRMMGMAEGKVVREESFPLRTLLEKENPSMVSAHLPEEAVFSIMLPVPDLSDYQIELLWGDDAAPYIQTSGKVTSGLLLRNLTWQELRDCNHSPCRLSYFLGGEFFNGGTVPVKGVVLGITLESKNTKDAAAEQEEQVRIEDLDLAPGEARLLEIEIPSEAQDTQRRLGFKPRVRILEEW